MDVLPNEQQLIDAGIDHEWVVMFLKMEETGITVQHIVFYDDHPTDDQMKALMVELEDGDQYEVKIVTKHQYFDFVKMTEPI